MVMKTNEVKILLQKYYSGQTSPMEESDLEKYFLGDRVDPEFDVDKLHFQAFASMRDEDIEVPADLEISVLNTLKSVQKVKTRENRRIVYISLSIAAGLLLMVSTFVFISRKDQSGYITDPKVAYAESREALEMVSKYFNEGTSQLSSLGKINQAVEPLNKLQTLDNAVKKLSKLGKTQTQK
jgi:hypothetical protein